MADSLNGAEETQPKRIKPIFSLLRRSWARLNVRFWASETAVMTTMAVLVGLGGGLGTVLFRNAVDGVSELASSGSATLGPGGLIFLILPALGGLAVGLWMFWLAPQGPGQGVAGIMEAVALHGGRIDARGAIGRIVGAVMTVGSGGSAGPEDPSVQIGATFGSVVSRHFRLSEMRGCCRSERRVQCAHRGCLFRHRNYPR